MLVVRWWGGTWSTSMAGSALACPRASNAHDAPPRCGPTCRHHLQGRRLRLPPPEAEHVLLQVHQQDDRSSELRVVSADYQIVHAPRAAQVAPGPHGPPLAALLPPAAGAATTAPRRASSPTPVSAAALPNHSLLPCVVATPPVLPRQDPNRAGASPPPLLLQSVSRASASPQAEPPAHRFSETLRGPSNARHVCSPG